MTELPRLASPPRAWTGAGVWRVAAIVALAAVLAAVIAHIGLGVAREVGRLAVPPTYDDVAYFQSAAAWLAAAPARGFGANLYALLDQHAPVSTLIGIIGFALQPVGYDGPYEVGGIVIFAFLLGIAALARRRPLREVATCMVAAACVPVVWHTMTESRPDLPWGLAVSLAVGALLSRPLLSRGFGSLVLLGLLSGLACGIKPTAAPGALACVGFAALAQAICGCAEADVRSWRAAVRRAGPSLLVFWLALVVGAACLVGVGTVETLHYILSAMIYDRDFWVVHEGFINGLQHYSLSWDGQFALKRWLWVGVALFAIRFALSLRGDRADRPRALTLLATVAVAYAIPTLSNLKAYYLGAMFYDVFIVAMVLNFVAVAAALDDLRGARAPDGAVGTALRRAPLAIVVVLFAIACRPGHFVPVTTFSRDQISDMTVSAQRVWSVLQRLAPTAASGRPLVVTFSSPHPVTPATMELYAMRAGIPLEGRQGYFIRTLDEIEAAMSASDVAVVASRTMPENLPGPRLGDDIIRRLDANPRMCLVDAMPLLTLKTLRIYRRSDAGCDAVAKASPPASQ